MGSRKLTHLYETDEQGSQIATSFHDKPKILGHMIHLLSIYIESWRQRGIALSLLILADDTHSADFCYPNYVLFISDMV